MCGIAGYRSHKEIPVPILEKMVEALRHRGPDAAGFYRSGPYQAGMRRLSINDLATGDQPLYNRDKSVVLFYNGEIYNYPHLRRELEDKGYCFRTRSDGEVICHLFDEYGEKLFEKLDGMFAAALWIKQEQRLILARDLPGEKPLYYLRLSDTEVAFASEIKSLLHFPGWDRSLNYQALWDYPTFLWIPEPATVYREISALPRGHILTADDSGIQIRPYPNLFNQEPLSTNETEVVADTRRVVTEAIRSRLLADVPVGCFLSSGLDSSIVAAVAAQSLPNLTTFTIGFEDVADPYHGTADESASAAAYAKTLKVRHHTIAVTAEDFKNSLLSFCVYGDQPFAVSSGLGILAVAKAARALGIKVLLTGDGADECFGGYSWYRHLPVASPPGLAPLNLELSFQNFGLDLPQRLAALSRYTGPNRAWAWHYYAAESEKAGLFNFAPFAESQTSLRHFQTFKSVGAWSPEDFIRQDREFYFPYEMLRKADRMTMAHSVEGRVPFAAPAVLAHAEKLRYSQMVRGDTLKWVLREAFASLLPEQVRQRPKHGFNVPIDHWLKGEWAGLLEETFAADSALAKAGLIHPKSGAYAKHLLHDPQRLNGHTVFSLITLNLWLEHVHGNHR